VAVSEYDVSEPVFFKSGLAVNKELYTEKNNHVEGLFHQYLEGFVKAIQIVVSVVSDNRRINV
jgi:hypothetical protein